MSVAGFDVGNVNSITALARRKGVDVLLNGDSKRETPTIVNFAEKQRFIGCHAADKIARAPKNTVTELKMLLGRKFNDPELQRHIQSVSFTVEDDGNNMPVVPVNYLNETKRFTPEQLLAMVFKDLRSIAELNNGMAVSDVVVAVPCYFTDRQRRAVRDASQIAGMSLLRLISEPAAAALSYGIYRADLPEDKPMNVCFIDIGYSATQCCVATFKKGELKVQSVGWNRRIGGKYFDDKLYDHFAEQFKTKHGIDVRSSAKASLRLRSQLERSIKKILSANPQAMVTVECLLDDVDVTAKMTRDELEELAEPDFDEFTKPFADALQGADLSVSDIDSVELIGNASRVPCLVKQIEQFFGFQVKRTLNVSECVARGCALQGAMMSPQFRVREFDVQDCYPFAVNFSWLNADDGQLNTTEVFKPNNAVPSSKLLTFYRSESFGVEATYGESADLPEKYDRSIAKFEIGPITSNGREKSKLKLRVKLNTDGVVEASSAQMVVDAEDDTSTQQQGASQGTPEGGRSMQTDEQEKAEEAMQEDGKKENNNETETNEQAKSSQGVEADKDKKNKPKKVKKDVQVKAAEAPGVDGERMSKMVEEEFNMAMQDRIEEETKESRNAVEEYIVTMRAKLSDELYEFSTDKERSELTQFLEEQEEWLYDEGENASKGVYNDKLEEIRNKCEHIDRRKREEEGRKGAMEKLKKAAEEVKRRVDDEEHTHIEEKDKRTVRSEAEGAETWLREKMEMQNKQGRASEAAVTVEEMNRKADSLLRVAEPILSTPKPKKEASPPEQEGKEEENDMEVDDKGENGESKEKEEDKE